MGTFKALGLNHWLVDRLSHLKVTTPTPVQENCIPEILKGRDVLGCAKTGTGKTLAFAAPILQKLAVDPYGVFALIISPTRELALQISEQLTILGKPINLKVATVNGGMNYVTQGHYLQKRPHVVVATPGRLAEILDFNMEGVKEVFQNLKFLVLDEADQLFSDLYTVHLKTIMDSIPAHRQTLLFSATITQTLAELQNISLNKAFYYEDKSSTSTADKLKQFYVLTPTGGKDAFVIHVIKKIFTKHPKTLIIVFVRTCKECQLLTATLEALDIGSQALHSKIPQFQRLRSLKKFRGSNMKVLVCTDLGSRGLDIPRVDTVINYSIPDSPKNYIHRVGRSARADRIGSAISFVTPHELEKLRAIEHEVNVEMEELPLELSNVKKDVLSVARTKREAEIRLEGQFRENDDRDDRNYRKTLIANGVDPHLADQMIEGRRHQFEEKKAKNRKERQQKTGNADSPQKTEGSAQKPSEKKSVPLKKKILKKKVVQKKAAGQTVSQQKRKVISKKRKATGAHILTKKRKSE